MKVKTEAVNDKQIEIHEDRVDPKHYGAKVDRIALFQRGRMRLRTFATIEAARAAALQETQTC